MLVKSFTTKSFLRKILGLLFLALVLVAWKSANQNLPRYLNDLRLKYQIFSENNPTNKIYLACDKPLYEQGDIIWFSVFTRTTGNIKDLDKKLIVELLSPQGAVIAKHDFGVTNFNFNHYRNFNLKADQPGGLYKLKAYLKDEGSNKNESEFVKEIQVQQVVMPRLKLNLEFEEKAYGPCSEVKAKVKAFSNTNEPLLGSNFRYIISLAGNQIQEASSTIDSFGNANIKFQLPANLETTDGLLNLVFQYEGISESVSRSIPIVLNKIQLRFFPEGGELVSGLQSQVAFQALNEFDNAADASGEIVDQNGNVVSTFTSFHNGMGEFTLRPEEGKTYSARIKSPAGNSGNYPLPGAIKKGFVMQVHQQDKENLKVTIRSAISTQAVLVGQMKGKWYFEKIIDLKPGENQQDLLTTDLPIGVLQLTLFDKKLIERAERLVFVNNHKQLNLTIKTDKQKYLPREKVTLTVNASDESGLPMPADLMLSVVNDQVLAQMDDKSSNILSWMLVESEIKGKVEEPKFYFDKTEPKAPIALDLLLKTAGWRKFKWEEIRKTALPSYNYALANILEKSYYEISLSDKPQVEKEISGRIILLKTQKPVKNTQVYLLREGKIYNKTMVDEKGNFSFPKLFRGTYSVSIMKDEDDPFLIPNIEVITNNNTILNIKYPEVKKLLFKNDHLKHKIYFSSTSPITNPETEIYGKIKGRLIEKHTREPIPFGNVVVKRKGVQKGYAQTDINGYFYISPLKFGLYTIECPNVGYLTYTIENVEVKANTTTIVNLALDPNVTFIYEVEIVAYKEPLGRTGFLGSNGYSNRRPAQKPARNKKENSSNSIPENENNKSNSYLKNQNNKTDQEVVKIFDNYKPKNISSGEIGEYTRIREFAAPVYSKTNNVQERTDFRKTLFWKPLIRVDKNGTSVIEFYTGDEISSYNIMVEGISTDGRPGRNEQKFYTQLPLSLAAKLPNLTLQADRLSIPLILKNNTENEVTGNLKISHPTGWKFLGNVSSKQAVKANSSSMVYLDYEVLDQPGTFNFSATFDALGLQDAFSQPIRVEKRGFPIHKAVSGSAKEQEYSLNISEMTPGTSNVSFSAYPTLVSNMLTGIEGMLREPHGCFEQTSSSSYPNILVLDYLRSQTNPDQEAIAKAEELLEKGYKRILTFQNKESGFEYFGGSPGNVTMTAYALLQFADMQRVGGPVEASVINNTSKWLLNQRDGKGNFIQATPGYRYSLPDPAISNAYIVYSLSEAGYKGLDKEMELIYQSCLKSKDAYLNALAANAFYLSGNKVRGQEILTGLLNLQSENGSFKGTKHSGTYSMGQSLSLETTALAALAMLKAEEKPDKELDRAIRFLLQSRGSFGSFGSTQATVLTLKAISGYVRYIKQPAESGKIQLYVDSKKVGENSYTADQNVNIQINDLNKHFFKPGNYVVKVQYQKTNNPLPYSMAISYFTNQPPSSPECKVKLETSLTTAETSVGQTVRYVAKIKNVQNEGLPMTMAIIGIPAGLSVQPWQLKELQEKKVIDFYEITDNKLVCYFRSMAPNTEVAVNLDLKAEFPGTYEGPASSAYLYYTDEHKNWSPGTRITIKP